ncbi:hypothetical protein [Gracilimonas sp.]|uniref:hypothetical protein n=1 Tax=Gracilimonas sp. TaxID=1974203 RepID=UPI0025B8C15C|nr:hypothetical protein [Gracilimonas sp.]
MKFTKILPMLIILVGLLFMTPDTAKAQANGQGGNFGLGIMLGEPTGISIKSWNTSRSAFDLGAAWSFGRNDALHIHGDYLLHSWLTGIEEGDLAFYYGVGARLVLSDPDARAGIRVPIGLNYIIPNSQVDLFVEAVPILNFTPSTDFDGNGALGIRYYF